MGGRGGNFNNRQSNAVKAADTVSRRSQANDVANNIADVLKQHEDRRREVFGNLYKETSRRVTLMPDNLVQELYNRAQQGGLQQSADFYKKELERRRNK